jgi:hypothetical protein
MFILDNEWCFIHIPKTSGTNLTLIVPDDRAKKYQHNELWYKFWKNNLNDLRQMPKDQIKEIKDDLNIVKHAPLKFWQEEKIIQNHKIFTIVRNPYTRFISWHNEATRDIGRQISVENFISDDYCNNLLKKIPYNCLSNKTNQIDYFIDISGNIRIDKFYKLETELENLEKDFNLKDINTYKYNSYQYNKNYKEIYTDRLINWVQKTFERDFEYFKYNTKPFW